MSHPTKWRYWLLTESISRSALNFTPRSRSSYSQVKETSWLHLYRHTPWRWKTKVSLLVLGRLSICRKPSHTQLMISPQPSQKKTVKKLLYLWTWQHFKGGSLTLIPSEPATMHAVVMPAQLSAALRLDGVGHISMRSCDPCSKLQRLMMVNLWWMMAKRWLIMANLRLMMVNLSQ